MLLIILDTTAEKYLKRLCHFLIYYGLCVCIWTVWFALLHTNENDQTGMQNENFTRDYIESSALSHSHASLSLSTVYLVWMRSGDGWPHKRVACTCACNKKHRCATADQTCQISLNINLRSQHRSVYCPVIIYSTIQVRLDAFFKRTLWI